MVVPPQTTRSWGDANRNYIPDCDLLNTAGNGECGAAANLNFGKLVTPTSTYDPNLLEGSGVRPGNWQFGISVQQEVFPRVSVEAGYHRRNFDSFINPDPVTATSTLTTTFTVADNRAVDAGRLQPLQRSGAGRPAAAPVRWICHRRPQTYRRRCSAGPTTSSRVQPSSGRRATPGMAWMHR